MIRSNVMCGMVQCHRCTNAVNIVPECYVNDELRDGIIFCSRCKRVIGIIEMFQFDFLYFNPYAANEKHRRLRAGKSKYPRKLHFSTEAIPERIGLAGDHIEYIGPWFVLGERIAAEQAGAKATVRARCRNLAVDVHKHPWSGFARITIDEKASEVVDLYSAQSCACTIQITDDMPFGEHQLEIEALGQKNPLAQAGQVVLDGFTLYTDQTRPYVQRRVENRGNPYPQRFVELIDKVPRDGVILDCGGGVRQFDDPRFFNLEYTRDDLPDIFADSHALPLRDNCVDLILSQAVLEHVADPALVVREMHRILKPGGEIYIEAAFMQPLHGAPYHFFNLTPWGLDTICEIFAKIESGWSTGMLSTIDWMLRETHTLDRLAPERVENVRQFFQDVDQLMDYESSRAVAGMVYFHGRKV